MQQQDKCNLFENFEIAHNKKVQRMKSPAQLRQQIEKITQSLSYFQSKISDLKNNIQSLDMDEIKTLIEKLFSFSELKEEILSLISHLFTSPECFKQNKSSDIAPSGIQVIPAELSASQIENNEFFNPNSLISQKVVLKVLTHFGNFSKLPAQIQTVINFLKKPIQRKLSLQTNQLDLHFPNFYQDKKENQKGEDQVQSKICEQKKKVEKLSTFQTDKEMEQSDQSVQKVTNILETIQSKSLNYEESYRKYDERRLKGGEAMKKPTENFENTELSRKQKEKNTQRQKQPYYDIPIQMIVKRQMKDDFDQTQENKNKFEKFKNHHSDEDEEEQNMDKFEIQIKPIEKIFEEKKMKKKKSISGIYLSASVESVMCGFGRDESDDDDLPKTPVSNQAVADWEHPELDFLDSQDMGQSKSNNPNLYDSLGTSLVHKIPGDFKQSCIKENPQKKVNQIFQTVNLKGNTPIFIIASQSSSEVSKSDREMYMSQLQEKAPNINLNIKQNTIKEVTFEASEYYDLKDKLYASEEEKAQLSQKLKLYEGQIRKLKQQTKKQSFFGWEIQEQGHKVQWQEIGQLYEDKKEEILELKKQRDIKQKHQNQLKQKNQKLNEQNRQLVEENLHKKSEVEDLKQNLQQVENYYLKELEQVNCELEEKDANSRNLQKVVKQIEQLNKQIRKENSELKSYIDQMNKETEEGKIEIEDLKNQNEELEQKISQLSRILEKEKKDIKNMKFLHEQEFQKLKVDFFHEFQLKEARYKQIEVENKRLHKQILENLEELKFRNNTSEQQNKIIDELKSELQYQREFYPKKQQAIHDQQVDFLQRELDRKDAKLQELNFQLINMKKIRDIKIIFQGDKTQQGSFISEIKELILEYQSIIYHHHNVMRELQERVYEYLRDAISKELQADRLYENLMRLEGDFHDLMVEKINLQLENKKLKKTIKISERKISSIGSKLVFAVKDRLHEKQQRFEPEQKIKNYLKSQNSTVKLGHVDF